MENKNKFETMFNKFMSDMNDKVNFGQDEDNLKLAASKWFIKHEIDNGAHIVDEDEHAQLIKESIEFSEFVNSKMKEIKVIPDHVNIPIVLVDGGKMPKKAHVSDAGFDCYSRDRNVDYEKGIVSYDLGFKMELPEGYAAFMLSRSSVYKTNLILSNCVGLVDSGYRNEVKAKFRLVDSETSDNIYEVGDRVCQMVILPYPKINLFETETLSSSDRGEGGFGSTGR